MNRKKKIAITLTSLCLVAMVAIGATLAYLTDRTSPVKNTFTIGQGIELTLDEQAFDDPTKRVDTGNEYIELLPGASYIKDPTATLIKGSPDSFIYIKIVGVDANKDKLMVTHQGTAGIHEDFIKVEGSEDGIDGVYYYNKGKVSAKDSDTKLPPIFDSVTIDPRCNETTTFTDINVQACAIQATYTVNGVEKVLNPYNVGNATEDVSAPYQFSI